MEKKYSEQVFFCSSASRYFHETLHGSAANYKCFIMVEHADPFPAKPTDGHLDKPWLKKLDALSKKMHGKLLLIRNKSTGYKNSRVIYVDCVAQKYFVIESLIENLRQIDIEKSIASNETQWELDPFFVVCTNGKKDKCCAKFGFPAFKFFENILLPFCYDSYECTHLGGDRFAANAVLMPFGIYYGRVGVEDVHEIIKQTAFGRVLYQNYRGRSRQSFLDQAVECHLREHLQNFNIEFPMKISHREHKDDVITLRISFNEDCFEMTVQKEVIDYPHLLTCTSPHPENIVKYKLVSIQKK